MIGTQVLGDGVPDSAGAATDDSCWFHAFRVRGPPGALPAAAYGVGSPAAANAWSRSFCRSATSSSPTEKRTLVSEMPHAARPSSPSLRWVVVAGWVTMDFTSPRLLEISMSLRASSTAKASAPGMRSKVTTHTPTLMSDFTSSRWGWTGRLGYRIIDTAG